MPRLSITYKDDDHGDEPRMTVIQNTTDDNPLMNTENSVGIRQHLSKSLVLKTSIEI